MKKFDVVTQMTYLAQDFNNEEVMSPEAIERYEALEHALGFKEPSVRLVFCRARYNLKRGRLVQGLAEVRDVLNSRVGNEMVYGIGFSTIDMARQRLAEVGTRNPLDGEIGGAYEIINDYGRADFETHMTALRHYTYLGMREKAESLLLKLKALAPNYPGLKEIEEVLNEEVLNDKK